ncbi:MAG: BrnA antitoxin family protein [Aquabacterium sp.]|uniref:BrnA antitoxin family protein n=1 Tax=Aquabacterium sp. TaxID=1872578 RepID=UPI00272429A5|nr:BrnA antitoxin family protein [Aquabacterium sp.]MDO9002843.1 BrnA antitoxin family protein [Aquabacterium sp.]
MQKTVKTKSGRVLQLPTPAEDAAITSAANADPDASPFTDAEWEQVKPLARRGRPLGSGTKVQITMRVDAEVLDTFKATGPGWQTRINEVLRSWVKSHA